MTDKTPLKADELLALATALGPVGPKTHDFLVPSTADSDDTIMLMRASGIEFWQHLSRLSQTQGEVLRSVGIEGDSASYQILYLVDVGAESVQRQLGKNLPNWTDSRRFLTWNFAHAYGEHTSWGTPYLDPWDITLD